MRKIEALQIFAEELSTQRAALCIKEIGNKTIGSPDDFSRPALISAVQKLEEITGKKLLAAGLTPLKYLGVCKIEDLAAYFSVEGNKKIDALREKYNVFPKTRDDMLKTFREKLTEAYAANCFKENNDAFLALPVAEAVPDVYGMSSNWHSPIAWLQVEFDVYINVAKISGADTVTSVIDYFCQEYEKLL